MKNLRVIFLVLSMLQSFLSHLFYMYGSLYFFFEEINEVAVVTTLVSQGGGENAIVSIGGLWFGILAAFNFFRRKCVVKISDLVITFSVLMVQAFSLLLIEVASVSISLCQPDSWILWCWCAVYVAQWYFLLFGILILNKSTTSNARL